MRFFAYRRTFAELRAGRKGPACLGFARILYYGRTATQVLGDSDVLLYTDARFRHDPRRDAALWQFLGRLLHECTSAARFFQVRFTKPQVVLSDICRRAAFLQKIVPQRCIRASGGLEIAVEIHLRTVSASELRLRSALARQLHLCRTLAAEVHPCMASSASGMHFCIGSCMHPSRRPVSLAHWRMQRTAQRVCPLRSQVNSVRSQSFALSLLWSFSTICSTAVGCSVSRLPTM